MYAVFDCPIAVDDGAYKACLMAEEVRRNLAYLSIFLEFP
jgi:hypothetical protein